jgi:hypothetical protein
LANWESARAEAEGEAPQSQPLAYSADSSEKPKEEEKVVPSKKKPTLKSKPIAPEEKYYPKSVEELATPAPTFDPVTLKTNWGQTIGEQIQ